MTSTPRRIDHVVHAVHDLDAAAAFYERLGFQVGARNRHPWGTENRLIQFGRSFVEIITVGPDRQAIPEHRDGQFSFGAFVRDTLRQREGIAMLVLDSEDAAGDAARFAQAGIGDFEPFFFERRGRRPDGTETHVAFTLAFATDALAPGAGFFVCQQHLPENFWNPVFQNHPNGVREISCVGMKAREPSAHAPFLVSFTSAPVEDQGAGLSVRLRGGSLEVLPCGREALEHHDISFVVPDLAPIMSRFHDKAIPFETAGGVLRLAAEIGFGVELRFDALDLVRA